MPEQSNNPFRFWRELKSRKVIHVMTVYIAAAFSLLEITDIIIGPLNLPGRIITFVMVFAVIGFPIALLLSWFFKATPYGIKLRRNSGAAQWEDFSLAQIEQDDIKEADFHPDNIIPDTAGPTDEMLKAKKGKGKEKIVRISSFGVIGIAVIMFLFYGGKSIHFEERDWIVIADFENLTEETIFDNSLNTAFTLSIDQSRYVNVLSRQRMFEALKRMKKGNRLHIDEETGKEIAVREGIDVCIVPGISRVGGRYILTAKILEAGTGELMRSEVIYARDQDEVITKLDQLSHRIRRNLGESRYKISGQNKPLSKVTTASLDALKQFSMGVENHFNADFEGAKIHYENAIQIDSNFTAAKASLGNLLCERFDREQGQELLEEAMVSIDDLTDTEKYGILAFYASNIEGDLDKAIQYEETLIELYPDVSTYHNNLAWYFQNQGDYEKAVEEYKIALRIDPYFMLTYGGLIWTYLTNLGQMDSALVWSKSMTECGPENPWSYCYLGSAYVGIDSLDMAEDAYIKAKNLDPNLLHNQYRLAYVYRLQGKYEKSIAVLEEILRIDPEETSAHYNLGIIYKLMGEHENSRKHFLEFKKNAETWLRDYPDNHLSYYWYGLVLTHLGDINTAWQFGKKVIEIDTTAHLQFAEFLAVQDRKSEALDHLEKALQDGYRDLVWIKLSPDLFSLQNEERFQSLINEYFNGD